MYSAANLNPNPPTGAQGVSQAPQQSMGMSPDANSSQRMQTPLGMAPQSQPMAGYAHGGSIGKPRSSAPRGMIWADMNPHEVQILEHLQGKSERHPESGKRSFKHIDELMKNPHILNMVHHHAAKYGDGGLIHGEHAAQHPTHGDLESVLIGKHTNNVLKHLAGRHLTYNPDNGDPQYWSLGGALGGLWDTLKSGANTAYEGLKSAAPTIGKIGNAALPYIQEALAKTAGDRFGPLAASGVNMLGGLAHSGLNYLEGTGESKLPEQASTALGQGMGAGLGAKMGGASARGAMGSALGQAGSSYGGALGRGTEHFGRGIEAGNTMRQAAGAGMTKAADYFPGAMGGAMAGAGRSLSTPGGGFTGAMKNIGQGAYQGAGGAQGLAQTAGNAYNQYKGGMNPGQVGMQAAQRPYQPHTPGLTNQQAMQELPMYGG